MLYRVTIACLFIACAAPGGAQAAQQHSRKPQMVPPGWTVQPVQGRKDVIRYVSPDGEAMLTLRDAPAEGRVVADEFARQSHRNGDDVTYARKSQSWFVLSGYRDGRIFYTRLDLACGARRWHTLELTYPRSAKAEMDAEVKRLSHGLGHFQNVCPDSGRQG